MLVANKRSVLYQTLDNLMCSATYRDHFPFFFLLFLWVQSMQAKQQSLLKRVDALDEECETLQEQLGEREERQIDLHKQLQQMSEEKEQAQAQLAERQVWWSLVVPNSLMTTTFKASRLCCMLRCLVLTGPVFRAPKREADSGNKDGWGKEQSSWAEGIHTNLKGEGEAVGGLPRTQPSASSTK